MTVEHRKTVRRNRNVVMTHCPFCGESFVKRGGNGRVHHLTQCKAADDAREVQYE